MSDVLTRRLRYFLSPQMDIYKSIARKLFIDASVLDIGCNIGFGTLQFVGDDRLVVGMDIDPEVIEAATYCIPGVEWKVGDITQPLDKRYDAIVMIETLEHIKDWETALRNIANSLYGVLYISARNANADLRHNDRHEREWTAQEFVAALSKYFEDVDLYDYTLTTKLDDTTRATPLIAKAKNPRRI